MKRPDAIARADPALQRVDAPLLSLDLQIVTEHEIRAPRVTKIDPVSARRFHVHVRLASERDVDAQLLGSLREAYDLMA